MQSSASWNRDRAQAIIDTHRTLDGPALPILHALQAEFGFIPDEAVLMVAQALNLSRAEVHGIVTFYHDFRHEKPGHHVLKLCRAEACQARGADALAARAKARLHLDWGETAPNGAVTLEPVFCLGLCATAPAAMLHGRLAGRLDQERLDALIDETRP